MELVPDLELGTYRLTRKLGVGGMGEVWEAEDTRLRRTVAIKVLPPHVASDPESQARFNREARVAAQLYHPNVATIHSIEQASGRSFIVMELVRGESLKNLIGKGPLSETEALRIAQQVAAALDEAHNQGIVHRDIKPDNIMISGDRVKVLDFGIAKQVGPAQMPVRNHTTGFVTEAGMILGTVFYMSPEQALGKQLDARTDLFSLGVVLYQALTGQLPFVGETVTETLTLIIRDEPSPIRKVVPSITAGTAFIVERCMAKKKEDRFGSAKEVIDSIDAQMRFTPTVRSEARKRTSPMAAAATVRESRTPASPETSPAVARRNLPWIAILLAAITLITLATYGVIINRRRSTSTPAELADKPSAAGPSTAAAEQPAGTEPLTSELTVTQVNAPLIKEAPIAAPQTSSNAAGITSDPTTPTMPKTDRAPAPDSGDEAGSDLYDEGMVLLSRGNRIGAMIAFQAVVRKDPTHAPAHLKIGQLALANRNLTEAAAHFENALQHGDRLDARQRLLAQVGLAVANRDFTRAQSLAAELKSRYPEDLESLHFFNELKKATKDPRDLPSNRPPANSSKPFRQKPRPGN